MPSSFSIQMLIMLRPWALLIILWTCSFKKTMVSKVSIFGICIGQNTNISQWNTLHWNIRIEKLTFLKKVCNETIIIIYWRNTRNFFHHLVKFLVRTDNTSCKWGYYLIFRKVLVFHIFCWFTQMLLKNHQVVC